MGQFGGANSRAERRVKKEEDAQITGSKSIMYRRSGYNTANLGLSVKKVRRPDMMNLLELLSLRIFSICYFSPAVGHVLFLCCCVGITTCAEYTRFIDASYTKQVVHYNLAFSNSASAFF